MVTPRSSLTPCYFPCRLVLEGPRAYPMSLTRIGADRAMLTGEAPVDPGARVLLEMNRPTDGTHILLPVLVEKIRHEGQQFGWMPAVHVAFLESLEQCVAADQTDELEALTDDSLGDIDPLLDALRRESLAGSSDPDEPPLSLADAVPAARHSVSLDDADQVARAVELPGEGRSSGPRPGLFARPRRGALPRRETAATPWTETAGEPLPVEAPPVQRETRILSEIPVTCLWAGEYRTATAQDFSRKGMFLAMMPGDPLPALDEVVRLEFPIPVESSVRVVGFLAEVRWTHGADVQSSVGHGVGLRIISFDRPGQAEIYEGYVEALLTG